MSARRPPTTEKRFISREEAIGRLVHDGASREHALERLCDALLHEELDWRLHDPYEKERPFPSVYRRAIGAIENTELWKQLVAFDPSPARALRLLLERQPKSDEWEILIEDSPRFWGRKRKPQLPLNKDDEAKARLTELRQAGYSKPGAWSNLRKSYPSHHLSDKRIHGYDVPFKRGPRSSN